MKPNNSRIPITMHMALLLRVQMYLVCVYHYHTALQKLYCIILVTATDPD